MPEPTQSNSATPAVDITATLAAACRSTTVLGIVVMLAPTVAGLFGFELKLSNELLKEWVELIGAAIALYGRTKAAGPLLVRRTAAALALLLCCTGCSSMRYTASLSTSYHGNSLRVLTDGKTITADVTLPDLGGFAK